jgi:hypothetical protein
MPEDIFNPGDKRVIEFTPDPGAKIEQIAPVIARLTRRLKMDAEIHFPQFVVEVPQGAKPQEIIEAYYRVAVDYLPEVRPVPRRPGPPGPR